MDCVRTCDAYILAEKSPHQHVPLTVAVDIGGEAGFVCTYIATRQRRRYGFSRYVATCKPRQHPWPKPSDKGEEGNYPYFLEYRRIFESYPINTAVIGACAFDSSRDSEAVPCAIHNQNITSA